MIMDTLRRLLLLPGEKLVLFTSIGKIFPEGKASIRSFLNYMEGMRAEALKLASGDLDAVGVRDVIFGRESAMAGLTGGHYSILNLVQKLLDG